MALHGNPTRTRSIEKRWLREVKKRFKLFASTVLDELPAIQVNRIATDAIRVKSFMLFFEEKINEILLGGGSLNWQAKYQLEAYTRAVHRARQELRSLGVPISVSPQEAAQIALLQGEVTDVFSGISYDTVRHVDELELIYTRSYESLKNWTDAMARDVRSIVSDAVRQGKGINDIADEIHSRTMVTLSRAQLIARTETIQAYQRGTISETEAISTETGEDVRLRWVTAVDGRVRDQHAAWHGDLMTTEEAARNIQVSPYNCRCAQSPVVLALDTEKRKNRFKEEKKYLKELQKVV